jgi:adenylosuccinate synthase
LFVSSRASLILPSHVALDRAREAALGDEGVGTTLRGIGPAYEDKAARTGVRAGDVIYPDLLRDRIRKNIEDANRELVSMGAEPIETEQAIDHYIGEAIRLAPYVCDTAVMLNSAVGEGRSVLLEGAQGTMLDIDHGTYPFVTSSSATAGGAATGTGLPPRSITGVLAIAKAYTTRVGGGPFPTELNDEAGEYLRKRGNEYGASTGRPRRTGWFDSVVARYSQMINGIDAFVLTKLDVLDEFEEIKVCTAYRCRGEITEGMPYGASLLEESEPVYETLPGWKADTSGVTDYEELPAEAKDYVSRIEELIGAPVAMISTGPERTETIIRQDSIVGEWMK